MHRAPGAEQGDAAEAGGDEHEAEGAATGIRFGDDFRCPAQILDDGEQVAAGDDGESDDGAADLQPNRKFFNRPEDDDAAGGAGADQDGEKVAVGPVRRGALIAFLFPTMRFGNEHADKEGDQGGGGAEHHEQPPALVLGGDEVVDPGFGEAGLQEQLAYMLHVGDECVTEFWKHKKTGEGRSVVYRWNPRKEAR